MRKRAERLVCRAGLYRPTRNTYQRLFNREYFAYRHVARGFFEQFVPRDGLVFDVGANRGLYSEMFLELGARVVAIEPNPVLAERIRLRYGSGPLTVESAAAGDSDGSGTLHLGLDDIYSTLSTEWVDVVHDSPGLPDRWSGMVEVPILTLDRLVASHGVPDFVKIDVEGFEREVLRGLSHAVPSMSFEFQCPALDVARECVATMERLGSYEFNYAGGEEVQLARDTWTGPDEVFSALEDLKQRDFKAHGDIYLRHAAG